MKKKISLIISTVVFFVVAFMVVEAFAFDLPANSYWENEGNSTCNHSFNYCYGYNANCIYDGEQVYSCSKCDAQYKTVQKATGHNYVDVLESKAEAKTDNNYGTNGKRHKECTICKSYIDYKTIAYPSEYTISPLDFTYDGSAKYPAVEVKDCDGNVISANNCTLRYYNNVGVGKASVEINFVGDYSGTVVKSFRIKPKKPTLNSVKYVSTGKIKASWKKNTSGTGYIVQYSTSSKFARPNTCTVLVGKNTTLTKTISSLPAKKYYVRIATYTNVDGEKYRSAWSNKKTVTVKKGVSLKTMINATKTDLSGRNDIKALTHGSVDIKKYKTTYDRMKAIYDWHSKNNTKYFANCMQCNMNFNDCLYYLYGKNKQYDDFVWLAAGNFKNSNGSVVMHKWPVIYFQGVGYIIDPRLQGYTSNKKGTQYFGVPLGSKLGKRYLLDGYWFYWSPDSYLTIV